MREFLTLPVAEVRLASSEDQGTFEGYAAVFGDLVESYGEVVLPGAFTRTLQEHAARKTAPVMLWGHRDNDAIGVWTSLAEDARGLKVAGRLVTATTRGREALELLKANAVSGLSIGFNTKKFTRTADGVRQLQDVDLLEISLVSMPASTNARITNVRNAAHADIAAFTQAARRAAATFKGA